MSELPDPDSFGDYADWPGREVHGPGGRLGKVVEIYLDDATTARKSPRCLRIAPSSASLLFAFPELALGDPAALDLQLSQLARRTDERPGLPAGGPPASAAVGVAKQRHRRPGALRLGGSWVSQGTSGRRGGGWSISAETPAGRR